MIVKTTKEINGVLYDYTYSDIGMMIERNGAYYSEAIDPINSNREYAETDKPIEGDETEAIDPIDSDREYTETENELPKEEEIKE